MTIAIINNVGFQKHLPLLLLNRKVKFLLNFNSSGWQNIFGVQETFGVFSSFHLTLHNKHDTLIQTT